MSVTIGASTRVSPDVACLKLSLPNRQTYRQTQTIGRNKHIHFYMYISIYPYLHISTNI